MHALIMSSGLLCTLSYGVMNEDKNTVPVSQHPVRVDHVRHDFVNCFRYHHFSARAGQWQIYRHMALGVFDRMAYRIYGNTHHCATSAQAAGCNSR
jgi:hypothetical protein